MLCLQKFFLGKTKTFILIWNCCFVFECVCRMHKHPCMRDGGDCEYMWKIKSVVWISKNFPANFMENFQTKPFSCFCFLFSFELILDLYSFLPIHEHKYDYLFSKILIKNFQKFPKNKKDALCECAGVGMKMWVVCGGWYSEKRKLRIKLWLFFTAFGLLCKVF